jgi:hypothetical protein
MLVDLVVAAANKAPGRSRAGSAAANQWPDAQRAGPRFSGLCLARAGWRLRRCCHCDSELNGAHFLRRLPGVLVHADGARAQWLITPPDDLVEIAGAGLPWSSCCYWSAILVLKAIIRLLARINSAFCVLLNLM